MRLRSLAVICILLQGCAPDDLSPRSPWPIVQANPAQTVSGEVKSSVAATEPASPPVQDPPQPLAAALEPIAESPPPRLRNAELATWLKTPSAKGEQPLFLWARMDRTDLVAALTKDLNQRSRSGPVMSRSPNTSLQNPLHFARSAQMVEQLLAFGFEISSRDLNRQTPLHSAAYGEHGDAFSRMVPGLCSEHVIIGWYFGDAIDLVRRQFTEENPLNWRDNKGMTPLLIAAMGGRADMVASLLACSSVRLDLIDSGGRTALHLAAMAPDTGALVALLEIKSDARREGPQSVNLNTPDLKGETALMLAQRFGRQAAFELLKARGAR